MKEGGGRIDDFSAGMESLRGTGSEEKRLPEREHIVADRRGVSQITVDAGEDRIHGRKFGKENDAGSIFRAGGERIEAGRVSLLKKRVEFEDEIPVRGELCKNFGRPVKERGGSVGVLPGRGIEEIQVAAGELGKDFVFGELVVEAAVFFVEIEPVVADCG